MVIFRHTCNRSLLNLLVAISGNILAKLSWFRRFECFSVVQIFSFPPNSAIPVMDECVPPQLHLLPHSFTEYQKLQN